jgi:alpha-N-acetylglucosamine transferase
MSSITPIATPSTNFHFTFVQNDNNNNINYEEETESNEIQVNYQTSMTRKHEETNNPLSEPNSPYNGNLTNNQVIIESEPNSPIQVPKTPKPILKRIVFAGNIVATRPLKELFLHVVNLKCPSIRLIARSIHVLFFSIFRWHFSDNVMMTVGKEKPKFIHSLKGNVEIYSKEEMQKNYPFMVESALCYSLKKEIPAISPGYDLGEAGNGNRKIDFNGKSVEIKPLTAQTVREFFHANGINLTTKEKGNSLWNLFRSNLLVRSSLN